MTKLSQHSLSDIFDTAPDKLTSAAARQLHEAYLFAQDAYGARLNTVEQPYILHSLEIVKTLIDLDMDNETLLAGMLYGVQPDSHFFGKLEKQFGRSVANIIRNLSKLEIYTVEGRSDNSKTLETIRRALLTIVEGDVRAVILRLAIALEDLRTAVALPEERRVEIAREVRNIYGPLANRLGIWRIKWELEDTAFRYLEPEKYHAIAADLAERRQDRQRRVENARAMLAERIAEVGISAQITGRPKHIYSIYRKMERKGVGVADIFDTQALRVIVDRDDPELPDLSDEERKKATYSRCYAVLGIVHNLWEPIPSEFDDYIQHPKPNGYRSLHTAVHIEDGSVLEVQIRTTLMHEEGERGIAAHWAYKEGGRATSNLNKQVRSLRELLNAIQGSGSSAETVGAMTDDAEADTLGEEMLAERIYVFTPNGDVYDLPLGATPIDFAYAIHTGLGNQCRGAKVNGKMVSLTYKLKSGDRVEIIKHKNGKPSRDWMTNPNYTATSRARSRIRQWFRKHERPQNIEYGRTAVEREIKQIGMSNQIAVEDVVAHFKEPDVDDFLAKVGFGDISMAQIEGALILLQRERKLAQAAQAAAEEEEDAPPAAVRPREGYRPKPKGLTVLGMGGLHTRFGQCCNPIPPEPILGYITRGAGVTIHRADCNQILAHRRQGEDDRIVPADWGVETGSYSVPYSIKAVRTSGLLEKIATILKGQNINLIKTKASNSKQHTHIYILAEVDGLEQAEWIRTRLQRLDQVLEVQSR